MWYFVSCGAINGRCGICLVSFSLTPTVFSLSALATLLRSPPGASPPQDPPSADLLQKVLNNQEEVLKGQKNILEKLDELDARVEKLAERNVTVGGGSEGQPTEPMGRGGFLKIFFN